MALALIFVLSSFVALAQDGAGTVPLPRARPDMSSAEPVVPLPRQRPAAVPPTGVDGSSPSAGDLYGPPTDPNAHLDAPAAPGAPPRVYQTACPAVLLGRVEAEVLPPIRDNGQCGTQSPLSVTGVLANGRMVPVSGGVMTDCGVASALPEWIESIDGYLLAEEGTRVAEVMVGTSYMCRNVNNAGNGDLSFHAFADALDVIGFKLEDGRTVTVESGWADALSPEGRLLRFAHDAACTRFTTVLGPEANALHHDHLHVDLGCHGKACMARLCE